MSAVIRNKRHSGAVSVKLLLTFAAVLALAACGGSSTLHGTIHLTSSSGVVHSGTSCAGTGGYDDMTAGAPVTVKNEAGSVIGTGSLGQGVSDPNYPTVACDFSFTISDLADAKFYSVEVSHRGAINYSKADLDKAGWKISLSLGS